MPWPSMVQVFLRMLKCASSFQTESLQLILAGLSGIVTFSYGYFIVGLVFGLVDVSFQQGVIGLIPLLVLLIILFMQLRCLFGTGPRAGPAQISRHSRH